MHINDTGQWVVVWLSTDDNTAPALAYAFFHVKAQAVRFSHVKGGDLHVKQPDGTLKRV